MSGLSLGASVPNLKFVYHFGAISIKRQKIKGSRDPGHAPFYPLLTFGGWRPPSDIVWTIWTAIIGSETTPANCFNTPIENALCTCQFTGKFGKIGDTVIGYCPQRKGSFVSGSRCLCQISSKSVKNCDRESADRQTNTHTDRQRWHGWSYNQSHPML